jgi:hypothetical protein
MFEYQCSALGVVVHATARSKKEAKQEAARLMLQELAMRGHPVPQPYGAPEAALPQVLSTSVTNNRSARIPPNSLLVLV